jgi:hypothetical protein
MSPPRRRPIAYGRTRGAGVYIFACARACPRNKTLVTLVTLVTNENRKRYINSLSVTIWAIVAFGGVTLLLAWSSGDG